MYLNFFKNFSNIKNHYILLGNQDSLDKIEQELNRTQKLCNQLSIYKNQEHPEKQLQIINLKKKLQDMNDIHNEEHDNLIGLLNYEKKLMIESQIEQTKKIADSVSSVFKKSKLFY